MMWQYIAVLVFSGALQVSHAAIGEDCFSVLDCSTEEAICHFGFSTCDTGTCQCAQDHYYHEADNACYPAVPYDTLGCERDEDCQALTVGAICSTVPTRRCECPSALPNYRLYGEIGYCHLIACTDATECLANIVHDNRATCDTENTVCECNPEYTPNDSEGAIVCEAALNEGDCTSPLICEADKGLTCESNQCACTGENVSWDDEHVMCINDDAVVSIGEDCVEGVYDGQAYCEEDLTCAICTAISENAQCQAGRQNVALGEPCVLEDSETTQVCFEGNAVCTEQYVGCTSGRCYCKEGFYEKAGLCYQDLQCLGDGDCTGTLEGIVTCTGGTCVCSGDTEHIIEETIGGMTYCGRAIGTACVAQDDPSECLGYIVDEGGESTTCTGMGAGTCGCNDGYVAEGNVCLRLLEGGTCDSNEVCRSNLECSEENQCACPADHAWDENFQECLHNSALKNQAATENCNEGADEPHERIYCSHWLECGLCPEADGEDPTTCQTVPGRIDLGGDCPFDSEESAEQCITDNSECAVAYDGCNRGVCSCAEGHYEDTSGMCREDGTCATDDDCGIFLPGSTCNTLRNCVCGEGRVPEEHNGVTYCGVPAGDPCLPADNPVPDGCLSEMIRPGSTECTRIIGSNCACLGGYQTVGNTCEPYSHGDSCEEGIGGNEGVCAAELELSCQDDGDGGRTCQCANNYGWQDAYGMCIHTSATIDIGEGEPCNIAADPEERIYCVPELVCAACPGLEDTICQVVPEVPGEDPNTTQPPPDDGTTADPDDGTEPTDPDDPNDPDDGAVHMHVSTALMVLAGILACYHIY